MEKSHSSEYFKSIYFAHSIKKADSFGKETHVVNI